MDALNCQVCMLRYDMQERKPKTLPCGHTFCLECVANWTKQQGRLVCPNCQQITYDDLDRIPDNQPIKDILMAQEVRCPSHLDQVVTTFCLQHMSVICPKCSHNGKGCPAKDLYEDTHEITNAILNQLEELNQGVDQAVLTPELRTAFGKRFKASLGKNIELMEKLKIQKKTKEKMTCAGCQGTADCYLVLKTFDAYCKRCSTAAPDSTGDTVVSFDQKTESEIAKLLASKLTLKGVNFCGLSQETLDLFQKRADLTPKQLQQLGKDLLLLDTPKPNYSGLPEQFICPGCKTKQTKSTCAMYVLPCKKLHALCENCLQPGTLSVTCPLDGLTYQKRTEELKRLQPAPMAAPGDYSPFSPMVPASPDQLPELRALGGPSIIRRPDGFPAANPMPAYGMPPYFNPAGSSLPMPPPSQGMYPMSSQVYNPSAQPPPFTPPKFGMPFLPPGAQPPSFAPPQYGVPGMPQPPSFAPPQYGVPGMPQPPSFTPPQYGFPPPSNPSQYVPSNPMPPNPSMIIPPGPSSGSLPGTRVPTPSVGPGQKYLVRFPSVLPMQGNPSTSGNNKGWYVNFSRSQVDAVTMTVLDSCKLESIGVANPVEPNRVAIMESVSLYNGKFAVGNPIAVHRGGEQLIGGNQVVTYINLRPAFQLPAMVPMTLKIKMITQLTNPPTQGFEIYRGNPYDRPDIWFGSDDLLWEFDETTRVGEGETVNGQNNLSGPLLVFIYSR